jgi:protein CLEC16A
MQRLRRRSPSPRPPPLVDKQSNSLERLHRLHDAFLITLAKMQTKRASDADLIEGLRAIAECVAYGEAADDSQYFELFCEVGLMQIFVQVAHGAKHSIAAKTQVIQSMALLIQNIRSTTSLYLLLSNNHINQLITPYGAAAARTPAAAAAAAAGAVTTAMPTKAGTEGGLPLHEEEFLSHYVSFLKAISVRLTAETVQFFLDAATDAFPLYRAALPLLTAGDPLVRTSALSICLHICSVPDAGVRAFLCASPANADPFFSQLLALLNSTYAALAGRVAEARAPAVSPDALQEGVSALQDLLYYVQDLLSLELHVLSERLAHRIVTEFVRPVVCEKLAEVSDANAISVLYYYWRYLCYCCYCCCVVC